MKFYNITELEKFNKTQIDELLNERCETLARLTKDALVGREIMSFGDLSRVRKQKEKKNFLIDDVTYTGKKGLCSITHKIVLSLDIALKDYDVKNGNLYDDELTNSIMNDILREAIDKHSHMRWGSKKEQGKNSINITMVFPGELLVPDLIAYEEYKKVEKENLKKKSSKTLEKNQKLKIQLDKELSINIEKLKENRFNIYYESSCYVPEDRIELMQYIDKYTSSFDREALKGVIKKHPDDKEIVLACLKRCNEEVFEYASENLRHDKSFVKEIIYEHNYINILEFVSKEIQDDEEMMRKAIEVGGGYIARAASDRLKNKKDFCMYAVESQADALFVISEEMKNDKDILLKAMEERGDYFAYFPAVATDKEMLIKAFSTAFDRQSYNLLKNTCEEFKNDKRVALAALQCCKDNYHHLGNELKEEIGNYDPVQYLTRIELNKQLNEEILEKPISKKRNKV